MNHKWSLCVTVLWVFGSSPAWAADSVSTPAVFFQEFSWSPDGKQIAFSAAISGQPADVYVMKLQGKMVTQLTKSDAFDGWTSWSQDGSTIFFTSRRDGHDQIYAMRPDGGQQKSVAATTSNDIAPAVSPDGSEMAFVSDRDGTPDIYIMSIDGAKVERITNSAEREYTPQWSRDSQQLTYYAESADHKDQVFVLDLNSPVPRRISEEGILNMYPSWSADGQSVIHCVSASADEKFVYGVTLDGAKREKLLPLPAFFARYSPDGKSIGYIAGAWPTSNIYVIDYTEGTLRCLTCDLSLISEEAAKQLSKNSKSRK